MCEDKFLGKYIYGRSIDGWEDSYIAVPYRNFENFLENMKLFLECDMEKKNFLNFPVWISIPEEREREENGYDMEVGAFQPRHGRAVIYIIENAKDEDVEEMQGIMEEYWKCWMDEGFNRHSSLEGGFPSLG